MNKQAIKSAFKTLRAQGYSMSDTISQLLLKYELWEILESIKSIHKK